MSARNTGLFVAGHVPPAEVEAALLATPGLDVSLFVGEEAVRVSHGQREGRAYTHVGLRLWEEGGLRLMDQAPLPGPEEPEMHLGQALSARHGEAAYLFYDEEHGAGGAALFRGGRLVARSALDARVLRPVLRTLDGEERVLVGLDPSDWIWRPASEAIAEAAASIVGPGIRDDDDIAALIEAASPAAPQGAVRDSAEPTPTPEGPGPGRRERLRGRLRAWLRR